jgi:DNA-binding LytR/AlgR family response regulator
MKTIKTNNQSLKERYTNSLASDSNYAIIEKGFDPIANAINIVFEEGNIDKLESLLDESGYYKEDYLMGKKGDASSLIAIKDIFYIEGINNDTYLHDENNEYKLKKKLYTLEENLRSRLFIRISKSYIVNVNKISKIKPLLNGKLLLILENDIRLEVTRHYLPSFKTLLGM